MLGNIGGHNEIQSPKQRYSLIDRPKLIELLNKKDEEELKTAHSMWVETILRNGPSCRNPLWTESIAVGDENFILSTKEKLGGKVIGRISVANNSGFELREPITAYTRLFNGEKHTLSPENSYRWKISA